jgi:hypothetical protein
MGRKKAAPGPLGIHEGYPVDKLSIAYRNAGDGLSESMSIDPIATDPGTINYWLVKTVTGPTDYNPLNGKGKRVKADDLVESGFVAYERVEDQMVLRVLRVPAEDAEARIDELEDRIATMVSDRERAERAARGEVDLDVAMKEAESGAFDPSAVGASVDG